MLKALTWTAIDRFGQQIVQLVIGILLARLLTPADYGLIGVLSIFVALSTVLIDGGFGQALIRKRTIDNKELSTIFILNLLISLILYLILFFSAPLIANFFAQPKLTLIARVLFTAIIFYALYFVQYVQIIRLLNYKFLALINFISILLSGCFAILMAINGYGVWAVVGQQVSFQFIRVILFPLFSHWTPIICFSKEVIKEHWGFSIRILGTSTLNVIFNYVYMVLIGRFYPLQQVGYYSQATKLGEIVNGATQQILQNGTFPLFSQIQNENERLVRVFRRLTKTISLVVFPMIAVLIAVAKPFIITLITEKWISAVILFQLLLIANFFTPQYTLNISILNSKGESNRTLRLEVIKKTLILLSILVSFSLGIVAMMIGFILASFSSYFISMQFIKKSLNHNIRHQLMDVIPLAIFGISLGVIISLLNIINMNPKILLCIQLICAFIIYLTIVRAFFSIEYFKTKTFVLSKIKKNKSLLKIRNK